jgi:hypothetical protein
MESKLHERVDVFAREDSDQSAVEGVHNQEVAHVVKLEQLQGVTQLDELVALHRLLDHEGA